MNAIVEQAPRAAADAPAWATRIVQDIVAWVQRRDIGAQQLTGYPTATPPTATVYPRALIYDSTLNVPAFSDVSGNWKALAAGVSIVAAGTYTPTLTNSANITSSTALACQYMRVGSVVTVSGGVTVTPTLLATLTTLGLSLPVASTFAATQNLGGAANSAALASASAAMFADTANARATMQMVSVGNGAETFYFSFTYQVI
jgi:hypothetical protein